MQKYTYIRIGVTRKHELETVHRITQAICYVNHYRKKFWDGNRLGHESWGVWLGRSDLTCLINFPVSMEELRKYLHYVFPLPYSQTASIAPP